VLLFSTLRTCGSQWQLPTASICCAHAYRALKLHFYKLRSVWWSIVVKSESHVNFYIKSYTAAHHKEFGQVSINILQGFCSITGHLLVLSFVTKPQPSRNGHNTQLHIFTPSLRHGIRPKTYLHTLEDSHTSRSPGWPVYRSARALARAAPSSKVSSPDFHAEPCISAAFHME